MNVLLWAFISLQLAAPLPSIYTKVQPRLDTAYPGYHYPNPPGGSSMFYVKPKFPKRLSVHSCIHTYADGLQTTCFAAEPKLL